MSSREKGSDELLCTVRSLVMVRQSVASAMGLTLKVAQVHSQPSKACHFLNNAYYTNYTPLETQTYYTTMLSVTNISKSIKSLNISTL